MRLQHGSLLVLALLLSFGPGKQPPARADMFVSSYNSDQVLRYDDDGHFLGNFSLGGGLHQPYGLAFDHNGDLLVAGGPSGRILRYDRDTGAYLGNFTTAAGYAVDLEFGPNGDLFDTAFTSDQVLRFDGSSGASKGFFLSGTLPDAPIGLEFGPDGHLYVGSAVTGQVLRYDGSTGAFMNVFATSPNGGIGDILFAPDGALLVGSGNQILRFDSAGVYEGVFASGGGLSTPYGLRFGPGGDLFVASEATDQILRYSGINGAFEGVFASGGGLDAPTFILFTPTLVPEPSTLALLGLGALGPLTFVLIRRRRASRITRGTRLMSNAARLCLVAGLVLACGLGSARAGTSLHHEFNVDGVLPSSEGWIYETGPSPIPEQDAYSASGGLLHLDTTAIAVNSSAQYTRPAGDYDAELDLVLEMRIRAVETGDGGLQFGVNDNVGPLTGRVNIAFVNNASLVFIDDDQVTRPFVPGSDFHTYRLVSSGGSLAYEFFIDGVLFHSGSYIVPSGVPGDRAFFFGDLSTHSNGNVRADFDYISIRNGVVPEPSTLALSGLGALGLLAFARVQRRGPARITRASTLSKGTNRSAARSCLLAALLLVGGVGQTLAGTSLHHEFNVDGVLLSNEGWTYNGNLTETSVYSVDGGLLHMNTTPQKVGNAAEYLRPQGDYDVTLDLRFEVRARFLEVAPTGEQTAFFGFGVNDRLGPSHERGNIYVYFSPQSIWFYLDDTRVPYQPADGLFHTYLLTASGASRTFEFFIDGVSVKSGSVGTGELAFPSSIFFGDDSSGGDAAILDVDYLRYDNAVVPEPSTLALLGTALLSLAALRRPRRGEWGRLAARPYH